MIKVKNTGDRIVFEGHEDTSSKCELTTLLCNSLLNDSNFECVRYESGYAEFKKVGKTEDLKFAGDQKTNSLTINFDSGITEVTVTADSDTITWSTSGESQTITVDTMLDYTFTVTLAAGHTLENVVVSGGDEWGGYVNVVSFTANTFIIYPSASGIGGSITLSTGDGSNPLTIDFDSGVKEVTAIDATDSSVTWSTSGESQVFGAYASENYTFTVTLAANHVLRKVTAPDTVTSFTDNTFVITAGTSGITGPITLYTKKDPDSIITFENLREFKDKSDGLYATKTEVENRHLYAHYIYCYYQNSGNEFVLNIINSESGPYTYATLVTYINSNSLKIVVSGCWGNERITYITTDGTSLQYAGWSSSESAISGSIPSSEVSISDTVVTII